jgi:hypothetical protein
MPKFPIIEITRKMRTLSGKFPTGCFESVSLLHVNNTEPFLLTSFYDSSTYSELYFVLQEFCSAIESKSDLTVLQGDLFIECYDGDKKVEHWKYSQVRMIEACFGELDFSSSSPMLLEIKWEYENFENI